jgi:hypothetical protein
MLNTNLVEIFVTLKKFDSAAGETLCDRFDAHRRVPKPSEPPYQCLPDYDYIQDHLQTALELQELPDNRVMWEATWISIMTSDHPMLKEAVRKLYTLGKLCLPADDPNIEEARSSVNETDEARVQITERNAKMKEKYDSDLASYYEHIVETGQKIADWWNELLTQAEITINSTPKNTKQEDLPKRVGFLIESIQQYSLFDKKQKISWFKQRPIALVKRFGITEPVGSGIFLEGNFLELDRVTNMIRKYNSLHKKFIEQTRNYLASKYMENKDFKDEANRIKRWFDTYQYNESKHKKNIWVVSRYDSSYETDKYYQVSAEDTYYSRITDLHSNILECVKHDLIDMKKKKIDGFDEIYLEWFEDRLADINARRKTQECDW